MSGRPPSMSEQFHDNICAFINSQRTAVQRQVVILSVSPLHVGVEAVIGGPAFILIPQAFLRGLLPFTVHFDDALSPELHICVDKDLQAVRLVLQNIVGTAANNDAWAFSASSIITLLWCSHRMSSLVGPNIRLEKAADRKLPGAYSPASFT